MEISHYNAIANCVQLVHKRSLVAATPAGLERKARLDASGERWLCALPMYHAYVGAPSSKHRPIPTQPAQGKG